LKVLKIILGIIIIAAVAFAAKLYSEGQKSITMKKPELIKDGVFLPCPDKPNCVCSMDDPGDKEHYLAPVSSEQNPISKILGIFEDNKQYTVIEVTDSMIRAEFKSKIFRFVDDVIFLYDPEAKLLHFRSSSRVGYSDMGANRKRIYAILKQLAL